MIKRIKLTERRQALALIQPPRAQGFIKFLDISELDFSHDDLTDIALENLTANKASFRGAILQGARFLDCEFDESDFEGAALLEAQFFDCRLNRTNFHLANYRDLSPSLVPIPR